MNLPPAIELLRRKKLHWEENASYNITNEILTHMAQIDNDERRSCVFPNNTGAFGKQSKLVKEDIDKKMKEIYLRNNFQYRP